jgi:hypothetical protein
LEVINEISRASGEIKSAIAQKLSHLALRGKQFVSTGDKQELEKFEWLIDNE